MEKEILIWIQSFSNPIMDIMMEGFTMLGETPVLIAILIVLFYGIDKKMGKQSIILFGGSMFVNLTVKDMFKMSRPIGVEGIISNRVATATGHSFPSGHTQAFATVYFTLSQLIKKQWFMWLGFFLMILVGMSRLYLGVHWPKDVVFGMLFAWISVTIVRKLLARFDDNLIAVIITVGLHTSLILYGSSDLMKMAGIMLGATIGFYIEEHWIHFSNEKNLQRRILRVLVGLILLFAVYYGCKVVFPQQPIFDYLRYSLVGLMACAGVPFVVKKISSPTIA